MTQAIKDITAGACSGWAQVIIMQPFEIIKVRLQTQSSINPEYSGILDCLKKTVKQEGFMALYKGTVSPLIGVGFQVSVQFALNEVSKRFFSQFKKRAEDLLPLHLVAASGFIAGFGSGLVATPIQHARIRIQIQKNDAASKVYSGSVDAAAKILKTYGIKGLFTGLVPTVFRECVGSTLYFTGYEFMMRKFLKPGQKTSDAPIHASILSGAFAGLCFWFLIYPVDFIKTSIQTDNLAQRKYKGMLDVFNEKLKQGGIKSFYKGYTVCLLRAIVVNAGGFVAFQTTLNYLNRNN